MSSLDAGNFAKSFTTWSLAPLNEKRMTSKHQQHFHIFKEGLFPQTSMKEPSQGALHSAFRLPS